MLWAALAPLRDADGSREKWLVFGAADRPVPATVRLTLGVQDVLVLQNSSPTSQVVGQLRVQPGHVFRLPFEQAGAFSYACSACPAAQIGVDVVAPPDPGFARLRWRFDGMIAALRYLPAIAPFGR